MFERYRKHEKTTLYTGINITKTLKMIELHISLKIHFLTTSFLKEIKKIEKKVN